MNKQIEALKMAIYSFEKLMVFDDLRAEIQICKEALAEAEKQEPVAWMNDKTPSGIFARHKEGANNFGCDIPLYTHPATWKSLSDDEILKLYNECHIYDYKMGLCFARAIEQALKEKNHE